MSQDNLLIINKYLNTKDKDIQDPFVSHIISSTLLDNSPLNLKRFTGVEIS